MNEKLEYLQRFQKIINTFVKHGFGQLINDLGIKEITRYLPRLNHKEQAEFKEISKAVRLRMVLEELGPTFIKFGQLLSIRVDILPPDYIKELRRLQDQVPPFPFFQVREVIEKELNCPLELLFEEFDQTPLAAASVGQVHRALLPGGESIAVKIQRPNIGNIFELDLKILTEIASLIDKYTAIGKLYNFKNIVEEFKNVINNELNFLQEGRNAEKFKNNFAQVDYIYIPDIYWSYTTEKILTLKFVEGTKLNDLEGLEKGNFSRHQIVEHLSKAYLKQILIDGFFHGDPHPGNLGVTQDKKLFFLDFGVAGHLNEEQRQLLNKLVLGLLSRDLEKALSAIISVGIVTATTDRNQLKWELERLQEKYYKLPLREIQLGQVLHELMEISFKQHIKLPRDLTLLAKTIFTLEGLISMLEPDYSIAEMAKPLSEELAKNRLTREKVVAIVYNNINRYFKLLEILPDRIISILERVTEGNLKLRLEILEMERILTRINSMVNRISFSIVLASIIVGLCLIINSTEVILFRRFPLAEIGLLLAALMGFWWLWAILHSGKL